MQIGIIGTGDVGTTLAKGLKRHGHSVNLGSRSPEKLQTFSSSEGIPVTNFEVAASRDADLLILAVKGSAALSALDLIGSERLRGRIVIDATNPLADAAPDQGVLSLFTRPNESLMEALQQTYPEARFVKAFNSVGAASMVDPILTLVDRPCSIAATTPRQRKRFRDSSNRLVGKWPTWAAPSPPVPSSHCLFSGVSLGLGKTSGPTPSNCCDGERCASLVAYGPEG